MTRQREKTDLAAFSGFYKSSYKTLSKEAAAFNRHLKKDDNPLLAIFREDLADLNTGGKLLRGMLINLGYRLAGNEDITPSNALALAFEVFQTAVLVHDDVIDNAGIRRGKYTVRRRYEHRLHVRDIKMVAKADSASDVARSAAICVGDFGLYAANLQIAKAYDGQACLGKLIQYFDETILNTIRGELLDVVLPYELQDESRSEEEALKLLEKSIFDIYYLKTACYSVIGPLHLGMILGGADEKQMAAVDRFAREIGIAYQIMDDILGIFADEDVLGKDVGGDVIEYKQTILYMYVRMMKPEYYEKLSKYYGKAIVTREDLEAVREIFTESGALDYARSMLGSYFEKAERKLARMSFISDEDKAILRGFIAYCKGRRK